LIESGQVCIVFTRNNLFRSIFIKFRLNYIIPKYTCDPLCTCLLLSLPFYSQQLDNNTSELHLGLNTRVRDLREQKNLRQDENSKLQGGKKASNVWLAF